MKPNLPEWEKPVLKKIEVAMVTSAGAAKGKDATKKAKSKS
jgi:hypothetical protein